MESVAGLFGGAGGAAGGEAAAAAGSSTTYTTISTAASVLQGLAQIKAGMDQQSLYAAEGAQARLRSRGEAVKYEMQANSIAKRALEAQALARARAAAGGIDPFSGSAMFIQNISAQEAGEEMELSRENAKLALLAGDQQAEAFKRAGKTARTRGLLSGIATVATSYGKTSKIGGPVAAPRAPTSSVNVWGVPRYG